MSDEQGTEKPDFQMEDLRTDSPSSFGVFFYQQFPEFFSFANLLLHDARSAKNATAGAFFELWTRIGNFVDEASVKAYLYTAIRDNSLSYLKGLQQQPTSSQPHPGSPRLNPASPKLNPTILQFHPASPQSHPAASQPQTTSAYYTFDAEMAGTLPPALLRDILGFVDRFELTR